MQSLKLSGTDHEYFYCNTKKIDKVEKLTNVLPKGQKTLFFNFNQCSFKNALEPERLFEFLIKNQDLRYLCISRCRLDKIMPALTKYLNENDKLISFSFVLNNFKSSHVDLFGENEEIKDDELEELQKKGCSSDFDVI
jgi:hypothetical protein